MLWSHDQGFGHVPVSNKEHDAIKNIVKNSLFGQIIT